VTPEKIIEVARKYREFIINTFPRIHPQRMDGSKADSHLNLAEALCHYLDMCDHIVEYAKNPDTIGKANRHLGYLQGCLSARGFFTLDELRNHNRPPESAP